MSGADDDDPVALPASDAQRFISEHPAVQVIDVRTTDSRRGRPVIEGAVHVDVKEQLKAGDTASLLDAIDPERPVLAICNSGGTCTLAASVLRDHGIDAHSIDGGMSAWTEQGLPTSDT